MGLWVRAEVVIASISIVRVLLPHDLLRDKVGIAMERRISNLRSYMVVGFIFAQHPSTFHI